MKQLQLLFIFCLLILQSTNAQKIYNQFDASKYIVLKRDKFDSFIFPFAKSTTLTSAEIKKVQYLIQRAVIDHNKKAKFNMQRIPPNNSYNIQLVPVLNSIGQKEVWVNCLCSGTDDNWKKGITVVDDGGNCFFNLKINLTLKISYDFFVNGYA